MDTGADHHAATLDRAQRRGHQRADRSKDDSRVQHRRRRLIRRTSPHRAKLAREILCLGIAWAGESVNLATLPACNLRNDVRRGAKPVQSEPPRLSSHAQRAVPNQPRAQQWRSLDVAIPRRHRKTESLIGQCEFAVAAIDVVTGEARLRAQIFAPRSTEFAHTAGPTKPRHANPVADLKSLHISTECSHAANDLVARYQWQFRLRQLAVHHVQVSATHRAGMHTDQHLAGSRCRYGHRGQPQPCSRGIKHHAAHRLRSHFRHHVTLAKSARYYHIQLHQFDTGTMK